MVARLILIIIVIQYLKCKSKFKKEFLIIGHDHGRIRNNAFDPFFLIYNHLMDFAIYIFFKNINILNIQLIINSYLNSEFILFFSNIFNHYFLEINLQKSKRMELSKNELSKSILGSNFFFAGLRHSGSQHLKFIKLVSDNINFSKYI